jgi:hypothetical protein
MIPRSISPASRTPYRSDLKAQRRGGRLNHAELTRPGGYGKVSEHTNLRHARRGLLKQFEPFPAQGVFELHEPRGVTARVRQTFDEPGSDGIDDNHENDWDRSGRLQQWTLGRRTISRLCSTNPPEEIANEGKP